jgi:O-glycosyl hydrolase
MLYLSILTGLALGAQTINLHGIVTNKAGNPIVGAIVSLVKQSLKDTTDSKGEYKLIEGVAVVPLLVPKTQFVTLSSNILEISLPEPSPVKVEIFDLKGKLLQKNVLQNAPSGFYRLNVAENTNTGNLLVIKASIGKDLMTFRSIPLKNRSYSVKSALGNSTFADGKLEKVATAINDTLKVTAAQFSPKTITITNYVQELDITLDSASTTNGITVQLDQTKQLIRGFGINNTWENIGNAISKCFDSTSGLGLNVLRIGMQPNADNVSAYQSFDDVKAAAKLGCKYIIGTVWSAPAKFKTNSNLNAGGYLKEEYYQDWAKAIAKFPKVVKDGSGIDLYAMSPQNETDFASCASKGEPCTVDYVTMLWTGQMYAKFFEVVGPLIKAAGCKAMAPEASEWLHAWSDFSACCSEPSGKGSSDPLGCGYLGKDGKPLCDHQKGYDYGHWLYANKKAWDAIDIFSTHQYDTQVAESWPADVPRTNAIGTIEVWQTEMSGVRYWPEQGDFSGSSCTCSSHIKNGVAVARWIQNALTVGEASAWCYWWWSQTGDNEGITCGGSLTKRYYTYGNFSRYIRPGHKIVNIANTSLLPAKVLLVASKGDNGKVVIVAINETTTAQTIPITISGETAPTSFKPIITSVDKEGWKENESDVPVSNGVLTASLEAMSVTTFVSK